MTGLSQARNSGSGASGVTGVNGRLSAACLSYIRVLIDACEAFPEE